jgi:hypothetical protein
VKRLMNATPKRKPAGSQKRPTNPPKAKAAAQ